MGAKLSTILGARYGYRFMPVDHGKKKSETERKRIKRLKKNAINKGKFNSERIIHMHTVDQHKIDLMARILTKKYKENGS